MHTYMCSNTHEHAYTRTHIHMNTCTQEHTYRDTQRHTRTHTLLQYWTWWSLLLNGRNCDYPKPDNSFRGERFFISHVGKILQTQSFGFENKILKRKALKQESRKQTHKHNIFCLKIIHFRQPVLSITDFKINRMFLHIYIWTPYSLYHMCFCSFWDRFPFFAAVQVPQMMTAQMDRRLSCEPPYSLPVSNSSTQSRVSSTGKGPDEQARGPEFKFLVAT